MWYPNWLFTGSDTWPIGSAFAVSSNSLTNWPLLTQPRSPPDCELLESSELAAASWFQRVWSFGSCFS